MINVVGLRFQQGGKMLHYDAGTLTPQVGDYVVAEASRGYELGEVILGMNEMDEEQLKTALPKVVRLATQADIQQATENRAREMEAYHICQQKIAEHKLEMKLVSVESTFDRNKMLFYFTAEGRVDFRALVKDLASTFKTRIELRQIGVRDEARMLGGLGPCGRPICCGAFLNDFQPVSIKMAKEQNLSLNPTKISGVCGRLMCCLKYEQDQYEETRKRMPRVGREVVTPDGSGTVTDLNIVKETVSVRIMNGDSGEIREYPLEKISKPGEPRTAEMDAAEVPELESGMTEEEEALDEAFAEERPRPAEERRPVERSVERPAQKKPRKPRGEKNAKSGPGARRSRIAEERMRDLEEDEELSGEEKKPARQPRSRNAGAGKPARGQKLGQPVRRENPDRKPALQADAGEARSAGENAGNPAQAEAATPSPKQEKRNGWADAVEKALQSAEG